MSERDPAPAIADHDRHAERVAAGARQDFDRKLAQLVPDPQREQQIEQQIEQRERSTAAARAGLVSGKPRPKGSSPAPESPPERSTAMEDLAAAYTTPQIMAALAHSDLGAEP